MLETMLSVLVTLGDADALHEWNLVPLADEGSRTAPSTATLAKVLDLDHLHIGEHGWLLLHDGYPLMALCEHSGLHYRGKATLLPDDPLKAVAAVLWLVHAGIENKAA